MVEVHVAVTLGLACERVLFETAWQGCVMCVCVCAPMGVSA